MSAQLIDEYRLWVFPLVLGDGKRLFEKGAVPHGLSLVDTKTSLTGVLINTYRSAGAARPGSFALETPTDAEMAGKRWAARVNAECKCPAPCGKGSRKQRSEIKRKQQ
jgi:RibD C-terminal domain